MGIITLYALFGNDIQALAFSASADTAFNCLTIIAMCLFFIEMFLASISKDDYFLSFYFWLDFISTATLITDIDWVVPNTSSVGQYASSISQQARAGRAARIIRLIRLIRLMRISKVFKQAQMVREKSRKLKKKRMERRKAVSVRIREIQNELKLDIEIPKNITEEHQSLTTINYQKTDKSIDKTNSNEDENVEDAPSESRISKTVSDLTIQRVVILVLLLTFILPLFIAGTYDSPYLASDFSCNLLSDSYENASSSDFALIKKTLLKKLVPEDYYPLIYLSGKGFTPIIYANIDELRENEKGVFESDNFTLIIDLRSNTRLSAGLSICKTVFLIILLSVGTAIFSTVNTNMVLLPLDSMFEKAKLLARNPLAYSEETEKQLGIYSLQYKMEEIDSQDKLEAQFVEERIVKFAKLLAVQYGVAGKKIITTNLNSNDYVNPMIPGEKMYGIFGFCIINGFEQLTEIMQTRILDFLNAIAETVHATVDKYFGATNKNIGESFLQAWKINSNDIEVSKDGRIIAKSRKVICLVDFAVFAYLKIIAKISKLNHIKAIIESPEVQRKLPKFFLQMGFGLHIGWGIEGAVGSVRKIDASYLSPNVNIAARLESCTRQYGIPILFSGQVYNFLSKYVQGYCREVDYIMVKGSKQPLKIYTIDVDTHPLKPKSCKYEGFAIGKKKEGRLEKKNNFHADVKEGYITSKMIYERDKDLKLMRAGIAKSFIKQFNQGYQAYNEGNWKKAIEYLNYALVIRPNDGPSVTLLSFMETHNNIPPENWKGFRELTEK